MIFYSAFDHSYLWLPLIGFIVGLLGSMIGGGGGFVFPPTLIVLFKVPAHVAVATSLAATLPICLMGTMGHYRNGNLDINTGIIFGIAGIFGAITGTFITIRLTSNQLQTIFGIYTILLAVMLMVNNYRDKKTKQSTRNNIRQFLGIIPKGSFYGFTGGMISGTFGTSGTAPVLTGLLVRKLPVKLIAGTSLMVIFINTLSALTGHLVLGIIDLTLVWLLTAGTVIGAFSGPKLTVRMNLPGKESSIRHIFVYVLLVFGILVLIT